MYEEEEYDKMAASSRILRPTPWPSSFFLFNYYYFVHLQCHLFMVFPLHIEKWLHLYCIFVFYMLLHIILHIRKYYLLHCKTPAIWLMHYNSQYCSVMWSMNTFASHYIQNKILSLWQKNIFNNIFLLIIGRRQHEWTLPLKLGVESFKFCCSWFPLCPSPYTITYMSYI